MQEKKEGRRRRKRSDPRRLTQLRCFAQDEGVGPELADGAVVEALVADGASEASTGQDVEHVAAGPDRPHHAGARHRRRRRRQQSGFELHNVKDSTLRRPLQSVSREPIRRQILARCVCVCVPEDGQAQRPQQQRQPQVEFGPGLHVVLSSKHQGGVQGAEHKRLTPAGENIRQSDA